MDDGTKYLVVCPGLVVASLGSGADDEGNFRNLIFVLAHEWGHHIDSADFSTVYSGFNSCLKKDFADGLKLPNVVSEILASTQLGPEWTRQRKVDVHMREMVADFWGVQAMVEYFSRAGLNQTPSERLEFLREAYGAICGSPDDGTHPSAEFRINVLLRRNAAMAPALGCLPRLGESYCGL